MSQRAVIEDIRARVAGCPPDACHGHVMRSVRPRFANEDDFFSGEGAELFGGRFSPPGISAVYTSLLPKTAAAEAFQGFGEAGFDLSRLRPRVLASAEVSLARVLDLTDAEIRRRVGYTLRDLLEEDWQAIQDGGEEPWTQTLGRAAHDAGFEAIRVHSARDRPEGVNLVIFDGNLVATGTVEAIGLDDLFPHPEAD